MISLFLYHQESVNYGLIFTTNKGKDNKKEKKDKAEKSEETEESSAVPVWGEDGSSTKRKRKRKRKRKSAPTDMDSIFGSSEAVGAKRAGGNDDDDTSSDIQTVYVAGVSYDAAEEDLADFFKECGKVVEVRLPRYQDSGKPMGYAHVDFDSSDAIDNALKLNKSRMMGRYLDISKANARKTATFRPSARPAGCKTVFIKNLPYDTNESQVQAAFQFCGKIASVRLVRWNHTGKLKGIGYVDFRREESAEIAVKKRHEIKVGGRPLIVDFESGKPKASFRSADGVQWSKLEQAQNKGGKGKRARRPAL